ncbi:MULTISPECIES: hypothetical protein [unclassified Microbacterium]|uniref:hypothetical protein n=1 Tax=unclassified Microbacterium TaxID=2609290 RepID=UPI000C2C1A69|nr:MULTISPECIES: hypothetical protein [unclassified Microbacterium]
MTIALPWRRRTSRETDHEGSTNIPAVLPVVTMTVQSDATLRVLVDGEQFDPSTFAPPWQRSSFAQIISSVMKQRRSPVRVVMHELDGTVYTDIVTTPLRHVPDPPALPEQSPASAQDGTPAPGKTDSMHLLAVANDGGFVPGEEVAVAVIVRHTAASREGATRAQIEPRLLDLSPTHEVILLGRVSGTCVVDRVS